MGGVPRSRARRAAGNEGHRLCAESYRSPDLVGAAEQGVAPDGAPSLALLGMAPRG